MRLFPNSDQWIQSSVVRALFKQVERLVCILLTIPCSSAEAERSCSGLCRLKTYRRNSMTQARQNHLAILHVHQEMTDNIDVVAVAIDFVSKFDSILTTFGQYINAISSRL